MTKYLIEVTADCNDADYVSENYIGTDKDLDDIKTMLSYLKLFFDKYKELYTYYPHQGDMLEELDRCFYIIQDGMTIPIKHEKFLTFVKDNIEQANFLHDWTREHWPAINCDSLSHTLIRIKAYELKNEKPIIVL